MGSEMCIRDRGITDRYFCWVGGEYGSYSSHAVAIIENLGVELGFTTCSHPVLSSTSPLRIERTNVESGFPMERLKLCVSGIVDIRYFLKRRKLNSVFAISGSSA